MWLFLAANFRELYKGEVRRIPIPRLSEKGSEGGFEGGFGPYEEAEMGPNPAKLVADVSGSLLSTYLMWRRRFAWAMLAAFVPAVLASVLVIAYADLER